MDKAHLFRRAFHLCAPLFLVYYLFPEDMWGLDISSKLLLIMVFVIVMFIEGVRLATGTVFFGLRPYEKDQLSAYAWAAIAITIAFLFFPPVFVICAVTGLGWTDPLIGELRRKRKKLYPAIPLLVYFLITIGCLQLFSNVPIFAQLFMASLTAAVAIIVEGPRIKQIDDDFLMLVIPLFVMTGLYELMAFTGMLRI